MFFAHNPWTIAILVLIVVVVFGAKRLPEAGRALGQGMREFKDAITGKSSADEADEAAPEPKVIAAAQAAPHAGAEPEAAPSREAGAGPRA
jgi:sec-independent protein translocase protein TatA